MAAPRLVPFDTAAPPSIASSVVQMERILLPVDFSEPCLRVVLHASKFARYFGSEVSVLHVQTATETPQESGSNRSDGSSWRTYPSGECCFAAAIRRAQSSKWHTVIASG